ncbi:serine/threonine-protein phosphatase 7 [Hordeum vulgare]|nr:serine/threonine-protein phosphatase 7 [Hordeum vulgare]
MTVTLQDISMITTLPIEGKPLCMSTDFEGWWEHMEALIANFAHCLEDTNDDVIQTYAHVYMCYAISRTIFADGSGKNAQWMWLKALTVFDNKFSWGSAALAYLSQQLDEACRMSKRDGGIGGCMLLLSVEWKQYGARVSFGDAHG